MKGRGNAANQAVKASATMHVKNNKNSIGAASKKTKAGHLNAKQNRASP
jgi:hypothetical protein